MEAIYIIVAVLLSASVIACIGIWMYKSNDSYQAVRELVEDNTNAFCCFDMKGKCTFANMKARELFRIGQRESCEKIERFYQKWLEENEKMREEGAVWEQIYTIDGEDKHFMVEFQWLRGMNGKRKGCSYMLSDRTEEIKRFREEQYLATHDKQTGFYNSEYFFQKAEEIFKNDPDTERYMICMCFRNLKQVSDMFGEETGIQLLMAQSADLKYTDDDTCIQGKIEKDKFAMLIEKDNFNQELAADSKGKLKYVVDNVNYKMQVTIGVYRITDPTEDPRVMFEKACMAIEAQDGDYQKNMFYYDIKMMEQILHEKTIIKEFRHAIQNRQFDMFLQPQIAADGSLMGAEALVRWRHPEKGLVFPANFIDVIKKTGLIIQMDRYMWELAAKKLRQWKERGRSELSISVNISTEDFYYGDLYAEFTSLVEQYEIDPANLKLEITEGTVMSDDVQHKETLRKLQGYGFEVEIDDFGSGYSSLSMLKDIRANVLKIDTLYLRKTDELERSRAVINSIISMAQALGMGVISEGVETEEQFMFLKEKGCDGFQGYYFSKPIPVDEFEAKYLDI